MYKINYITMYMLKKKVIHKGIYEQIKCLKYLDVEAGDAISTSSVTFSSKTFPLSANSKVYCNISFIGTFLGPDPKFKNLLKK